MVTDLPFFKSCIICRELEEEEEKGCLLFLLPCIEKHSSTILLLLLQPPLVKSHKKASPFLHGVASICVKHRVAHQVEGDTCQRIEERISRTLASVCLFSFLSQSVSQSYSCSEIGFGFNYKLTTLHPFIEGKVVSNILNDIFVSWQRGMLVEILCHHTRSVNQFVQSFTTASAI